MIAYRVVTTTNGGDWFDELAAADAAVAGQLGVDPSVIESLRRRVTADPVVVRRDGARWRSRQVWAVRKGETNARIYEMLKVDETAYDH